MEKGRSKGYGRAKNGRSLGTDAAPKRRKVRGTKMALGVYRRKTKANGEVERTIQRPFRRKRFLTGPRTRLHGEFCAHACHFEFKDADGGRSYGRYGAEPRGRGKSVNSRQGQRWDIYRAT